jgi:hypothetical protein
MHVGPLPDAVIDQVVAMIRAMLREPIVSVRISTGVRYHDNYDTGIVEAEPTAGRTVTIDVNGGAVEERESDAMKLARLWREVGRS